MSTDAADMGGSLLPDDNPGHDGQNPSEPDLFDSYDKPLCISNRRHNRKNCGLLLTCIDRCCSE